MPIVPFNPSSPNQLSILLFGGIIEEKCQVPILNELGIQEIYKTGEKRGQLKTKKGKHEVRIAGLGLVPLKEWETKKKGIYQTNEKILSLLARENCNDILSQKEIDACNIASIVLQIREKEKMLNTYYIGFEELIYPIDSCIHGSINHVTTDTGRTASNKPNLQNLPG